MEITNNFDKIKKWEILKGFINKIKDEKARKLYYKTLLVKATEEYGFNPQTGQISKQDIQLDDWEKEFVEDIKKTQEFELDVRKEKREKTAKEAKARMLDYIRKGGKYIDLPEDLQNEHIWNLYWECMTEEINDCVNFLEKNSLQTINKLV